MTKETHQKIYDNGKGSNQNRTTTVNTTKNVDKRGGAMYTGKVNHDEKSKTR